MGSTWFLFTVKYHSNCLVGSIVGSFSPTKPQPQLGDQVMFDYPTVADLTDFIVAQFSEGDDEAVSGALGGGNGRLDPLTLIRKYHHLS